jgi:spore maturation protein CgeE
MYSHNFTFVKETVDDQALKGIIEQEVIVRKSGNKKFLRLVINRKVDADLFNNYKHDYELYDYYGIETKDGLKLNVRKNTTVVIADNDRVYEDGRMVDIVANYQHMTLEFAIRRIDRKIEVYKDPNSFLNLYVCYDDIEPVGNCELLFNEKVAKIEDFDIIEMHQKKGYGSFVLKTLLNTCHETGIDNAYLVTDHNDTAKEMYKKCGFSLKGQRTEVMIHL